ncbi:hypothetical protein CAF53_02425 [Sphingobium sp. LB126]|uniref:hypothetical protein n=1 Tax=Sphingobium sp. LB126 TaxID=1983755 RepID=UPI000C20B1B0|nr:hypothetical protein [Sphingobium sp. LB126]PJG47222.1 hypothetical protein CAF53_02425 [Sphingobium sp. LB126]
MRVYGGCIEPGGYELENERVTAPCPDCGKPARHHHFERAEGSLNRYHTIDCDHCGHESGYDFLMP